MLHVALLRLCIVIIANISFLFKLKRNIFVFNSLRMNFSDVRTVVQSACVCVACVCALHAKYCSTSATHSHSTTKEFKRLNYTYTNKCKWQSTAHECFRFGSPFTSLSHRKSSFSGCLPERMNFERRTDLSCLQSAVTVPFPCVRCTFVFFYSLISRPSLLLL